MRLPDRLVWIDLETTGLSPENDRILEIATVITDSSLKELEAISQVVWVDATGLRMDDVVRKMHTDNGLLADLQWGLPLSTVGAHIVELISDWSAAGGPICGSTPQFDRAFLRHHLPPVERLFNHRVFDVSSLILGELVRTGTAESPQCRGGDAHRALPDIRASISKARELLGRQEAA